MAIVGASANPARASHDVWTLSEVAPATTSCIWSIRPSAKSTAPRSIRAWPSYRWSPISSTCSAATSTCPSVLDDTIKVGAKILWLQSGLWHEQVARDGEAAGLQVVMDRCLKVEHARLFA